MVNNTIVVCLIGNCGSGKSKTLEYIDNLGYSENNIIECYLNREPRDNDWGVQHIEEDAVTFIDYKTKDIEFRNNDELKQGKFIAHFSGYTQDKHYFALDEQVERNKINYYIVNPDAAEQVKKFYKGTDIKVITVYFKLDRTEIERRLLSRMEENIEQLNKDLHPGELEHLENNMVTQRIKLDDIIYDTFSADYIINSNTEVKGVAGKLMGVVSDYQLELALRGLEFET